MLFKNKPAPGIFTSIAGIPAGIVNNHNEAFFYWMKSNLLDASLFHVDAHSDMNEAKGVKRIEYADDYEKMNTANFICPAVNLGIISYIYWLNPHSTRRKLQKLENKDNKKLKADCLESGGLLNNLFSKRCDYVWPKGLYLGRGTILMEKEILLASGSPLILDIDLDAFCCHRNRTIPNLPLELLGHDIDRYDGVSGFKKRIHKTIDTLATLPKPDLITIARSLGDGIDECYVPLSRQKEVSRSLIAGLQELYSAERYLSFGAGER